MAVMSEAFDGASTPTEATASATAFPAAALSPDGGDGPRVAVVMGSDSDWSIMQDAAQVLTEFGVEHEVEVLSAHRTPEKMIEFGKSAYARGLRVIVAGAGGAAHLPGMLASVSTLPVIGVPVPLARLDGLDSLLSIVQMPAGVPVAAVSIGGAKNAGLLAVKVLAASDAGLTAKLEAYMQTLAAQVEQKNAALHAGLGHPPVS
jgi:5-(carboxyamino)imidazole ribonucleotide mutase